MARPTTARCCSISTNSSKEVSVVVCHKRGHTYGGRKILLNINTIETSVSSFFFLTHKLIPSTLRLTIYSTKSKENQMTIYMLGGLAINEVEVTEEEGASLIAEGKAFATYDEAYWEARLLDL